MRLWFDLETRSPIPIKRGVALYATQAEIIMCQWAVDDGPVHVEDLFAGKRPSDEFLQAVADCDELWAHGAEFEQTLVAACWPMFWPIIPANKWRCTMALARMHGLPGGLDKLSMIFKLGIEGKDTRGRDLIQLFCVPGKKGWKGTPATHPIEWNEFCEYGGLDITSMRAVHRKCPKWNATERMWAIWHLDQATNMEGVAVDLKLCEGAIEATTAAKKRHADQVEDMTLGVVQRATQRDRLLQYLADYGVTLPDLTADTVERRLEDENLPEHVKELLRVRQQASKASTAKYKRAVAQHVAGRLRNLLVFCGALRTSRWAGRTIQPQNFPRPKHESWEVEQAITAFREKAADLYNPDDVLGLASSALRGIIVAEEGRKLVVADLANIEGRDMAWIAGEQWKLDAFAAYDAGTGPDLYILSYARAFGLDPRSISKKDPRRQIGKVMELALQYYGGVGAFCSMAETYGLDLEQLAVEGWPSIPKETRIATQDLWEKAKTRKRTYGLPEHVWRTCMALVLLWREAHPAIVTFWAQLEQAVKLACANPGKRYPAGRVWLDRQANWMRIRLPSGRFLSYPAPRADFEVHDINFLGIDAYTKQWTRISTYSGKLAENIVQGNSADILMDGFLASARAGYKPVLTVHDEIICEPPDSSEFTVEGLAHLMTNSSPWSAGMPLAADGFESYRYAKR